MRATMTAFPLRSLWRPLLVVALSLETALAAPSLPALGARLDDLTVSGISSGAYMAVQFQVAHSSLVRGAGVIPGGPYYCAEGSTWRALTSCMSPSAWAPLASTSLTSAPMTG